MQKAFGFLTHLSYLLASRGICSGCLPIIDLSGDHRCQITIKNGINHLLQSVLNNLICSYQNMQM